MIILFCFKEIIRRRSQVIPYSEATDTENSY